MKKEIKTNRPPRLRGERDMKKEKIEIDKKQLEKWWEILNHWELPKEFPQPMTGDKKQYIRGAFEVVDYFITWKYPPGKFVERHSQDIKINERNSVKSR